MKIYLDLLPEERKKEIMRKNLFYRIIREELLLTVPIAALVVILLTIYISLKFRMENVENNFNVRNSQNNYEELNDYEKRIGEANIKISEMYKIQNNHLDWLGVFLKINNVIPSNVYLDGLSTNDYLVSLSGEAKTREDFLKFQESIKSEKCFSDIEAPLSNLVSKENVEFQVNFKVGENCLKNEDE